MLSFTSSALAALCNIRQNHGTLAFSWEGRRTLCDLCRFVLRSRLLVAPKISRQTFEKEKNVVYQIFRSLEKSREHKLKRHVLYDKEKVITSLD